MIAVVQGDEGLQLVGVDPPAPGYVRLYRYERHGVQPRAWDLAYWLDPVFCAGQAAHGRWFARSLDEVEWYRADLVQEPGEAAALKILDLPEHVADHYQVSRARRLVERFSVDVILPDGRPQRIEQEVAIHPQRYSRRPDEEIFVPRVLADLAQEVWISREPQIVCLRGPAVKHVADRAR